MKQQHKKGFSLVEILLIFTVLSVTMAAMIPMVSKKTVSEPRKIAHGTYRCIPNLNGGFNEELYSGTKQVSSQFGKSSCTFKIPKAAMYKVDLYSAGSGGTKYAEIITSQDDNRSNTYKIGSVNEKTGYNAQVRALTDADLYAAFNGLTVKDSYKRPDAGHGGAVEITYNTPYRATCSGNEIEQILVGAQAKIVADKLSTYQKEEKEYTDLFNQYIKPYNDAYAEYQSNNSTADSVCSSYYSALSDYNSCKNADLSSLEQAVADAKKVKDEYYDGWPGKYTYQQYREKKDAYDAAVAALDAAKDCGSEPSGSSCSTWTTIAATSLQKANNLAPTTTQKAEVSKAELDKNTAYSEYQSEFKKAEDLRKASRSSVFSSYTDPRKIAPVQWYGNAQSYNYQCYLAFKSYFDHVKKTYTMSDMGSKNFARLTEAKAVSKGGSGGLGGYLQLEYVIDYYPDIIKTSTGKSDYTYKDFIKNLNQQTAEGFYPVHCSKNSNLGTSDCVAGTLETRANHGENNLLDINTKYGASGGDKISQRQNGVSSGQNVKDMDYKPYSGYHVPSFYSNIKYYGKNVTATANNGLPSGGAVGDIGINPLGQINANDSAVVAIDASNFIAGSKVYSPPHGAHAENSPVIVTAGSAEIPKGVGRYTVKGLGAGDTREIQYPILSVKSALWTKTYILGSPGKAGQHKTFTVNNLGTVCKASIPTGGSIYDKIKADREEKFHPGYKAKYLQQLKDSVQVSINCYDQDDEKKVVFTASLPGGEYSDNNVQQLTSIYRFRLDLLNKGRIFNVGNGSPLTTYYNTFADSHLIPSSYWSKIHKSMKSLKTMQIGKPGQGTVFSDYCDVPKGTYSSTVKLHNESYKITGSTSTYYPMTVTAAGSTTNYGTAYTYYNYLTDGTKKTTDTTLSDRSYKENFDGLKNGLDCYIVNKTIQEQTSDRFVVDTDVTMRQYKDLYKFGYTAEGYKDLYNKVPDASEATGSGLSTGGPGAVVITW